MFAHASRGHLPAEGIDDFSYSIQLPKTGLILKALLMLRQNAQPRLAESAT